MTTIYFVTPKNSSKIQSVHHSDTAMGYTEATLVRAHKEIVHINSQQFKNNEDLTVFEVLTRDEYIALYGEDSIQNAEL